VPALADKRAAGSASRGIGGFIAIHEDCGAGFEIVRNGHGRLHLLCDGCGEHTEYGAADTEQLRAHGIHPEVATGRRFRPSRESVERWLPAPAAAPWWVPNAYIVAVILIGLALVAFGVIRSGGDDRAILGGGDQDEGGPPAVEQPEPTPAPITAGAAPAPAPKPAPAERPATAPELDRVEVLSRFAVGIPPGWEGGTGDGAVVISAPAGDAQLRVFLEPGGEKPGSLSDEASRFLTQEHPGAGITRPEPSRFGRFRAVELVATYDGGEERAALLSVNGYSYLLLSRVSEGASRSTRTSSVAALRSFRPL
jgi:hypothetical protein